MEDVFEPFVRLEASHSRRGAGLGLSITDSIACPRELHDYWRTPYYWE
jgi:signal transduction histidine kinase